VTAVDVTSGTAASTATGSTATATAISNDRPPPAIVTSPEALTLLQLLAGVDMAGAILPPDILARIIIGVCDNEHDANEHDEHDDDDANDNDISNSNMTIRDLVRRSSNWQQRSIRVYLDLLTGGSRALAAHLYSGRIHRENRWQAQWRRYVGIPMPRET
jgi:hypothetical protein